MTRRILVAGDVLRPQDDAFRSSQNGNTLWLTRLIARPLAAATGMKVTPLLWSPGERLPAEARGFDTQAFYAAAGQDPAIEGWVRLFDAPELPREAAALLAAPFADAAFVVGFELPPLIKRLLTALGRPWVDLNIHPYRFGPDLLFAAEAGDAEVLAALAPHHTPDSWFAPHADILAATAVKLPPALPVTESLLLVGQTRIDRSLISDGRLVDLRDFATPLRAALGTAPAIFKPHPYNADGFGLHDLGLPFARFRELAENIYILLAQDSVKRVVGVSSSVLAEARFWGKEAVWLGTPPMRIAPFRASLALGWHASVRDAWINADFWRDLLAPFWPVSARDGDRVALPPDTLRRSLRQYWGFDELTHQLPWDLAATRAAARAASGATR